MRVMSHERDSERGIAEKGSHLCENASLGLRADRNIFSQSWTSDRDIRKRVASARLPTCVPESIRRGKRPPTFSTRSDPRVSFKLAGTRSAHARTLRTRAKRTIGARNVERQCSPCDNSRAPAPRFHHSDRERFTPVETRRCGMLGANSYETSSTSRRNNRE